MEEDKQDTFDLEQRIFDIKDEPIPQGAWWWWFWLFFFDNPRDRSKPRQLMILWSSKKVKEIECNNMKLKPILDRSRLKGAVAAWYFDGEIMHHNLLLEPCDIEVSGKGLYTNSATPTSFKIKKAGNTIKIGENFLFIAEAGGEHSFTLPTYNSNNYVGNRGYSIIRLNHLDLTGTVDGVKIKGSAYFQRVFVTTPAVPWYWGIFHFENGGILSYFNPSFLGKSIKKDISFFDGSRMYKFSDIKVATDGGGNPSFIVSGENRKEKIKFIVDSYSHSSWTFGRRVLGFFPNKLVYNEYPAVISELELTEKRTGEKIDLRKLGKSVGNAEHTTGLLF